MPSWTFCKITSICILQGFAIHPKSWKGNRPNYMSILVEQGVEVPCSLHGAGNFPDIASVNSPNLQPRHAILRLIFIWPQALCQLDQFEQSMHVPMQLHHESERQGFLTSLNGPQSNKTYCRKTTLGPSLGANRHFAKILQSGHFWESGSMS